MRLRRRRRVMIALMLLQMQLVVRDIWVHQLYNDRRIKGEFYVHYPDLKKYEDKFFGFYRMSVETFHGLLTLVHRQLTSPGTNYRKSISAEEKLVLTLT